MKQLARPAGSTNVTHPQQLVSCKLRGFANWTALKNEWSAGPTRPFSVIQPGFVTREVFCGTAAAAVAPAVSKSTGHRIQTSKRTARGGGSASASRPWKKRKDCAHFVYDGANSLQELVAPMSLTSCRTQPMSIANEVEEPRAVRRGYEAS